MHFHVVKRDNCPIWQRAGMYVLAVLFVLKYILL